MLIETIVVRTEGAKLQVLVIEGGSFLWGGLRMGSEECLYGFGAVSKGKLLHYPIIIYYDRHVASRRRRGKGIRP
jgi:hypothetical protein